MAWEKANRTPYQRGRIAAERDAPREVPDDLDTSAMRFAASAWLDGYDSVPRLSKALQFDELRHKILISYTRIASCGAAERIAQERHRIELWSQMRKLVEEK